MTEEEIIDMAHELNSMSGDITALMIWIAETVEPIEKENTELKSKLNHTHCVECSRDFLHEINQLKLQVKVAGDRIDTLSSTNIALSNQIEKMKVLCKLS